MGNENNNSINHFYCIILAGGKGRRLWPVSRAEKPKQFLDFFGSGKTLLQETYERFCRILPEENIYVSTYQEYTDMVCEQLPQLTYDRLLREPIRRNTAPIAAWGTHRIGLRDPEASVIITPSDQLIFNEDAYRTDVINALQHVSDNDCLLTMGIKPTRPEPGYGYIQMGDNIGNSFYDVQSFTEKPEREFATIFMNSGEFLWNTGLFLSSLRSMRAQLQKLMPSVMGSLDEEKENATWSEEEAWAEAHYSMYPNMSLEHGVLERSDNVHVLECHFGWADIGAWHGIYEAQATTEGENVVLDTESMLSDTTGCVISLPKGRTAVINGLHNFIVAEHDDVLLITPRSDSSNQVVKLMNQFTLD